MWLGALWGVALLVEPALAQEPVPESTEEEAPAPVAGPSLELRVLSAEDQAEAMKEDVFRAKTTLQLLKEIVAAVGADGARARISHESALSGAFTIQSVSYYLDGSPIFSLTGEAVPPPGTSVMVYDGPVAPGAHELAVTLVLEGNGFGVFNYMDEYAFRVRSTQSISVDEGSVGTVQVVVKEKKRTREFEDRPQVTYTMTSTKVED